MRNSLCICLCLLALGAVWCAGCETKKPYGTERRLRLPAERQQVWAVAPALNLSGESGVDPLLQADLLYAQLQTVRGIVAVPVNRTAEVYAGMRIGSIQSPEQAADVCAALGADALIVPTVTLYDPYSPPKMGVSLQIFAANGTQLRGGQVPGAEQVRDLTRTARDAGEMLALPGPEVARGQFLQQAGLFDASHGSTRQAAQLYARGRSDPNGPAAGREVFLVMDRYASFVYHALLAEVMDDLRRRQAVVAAAR